VRKIKELLRLRFELGLGQRAIALGCPRGAGRAKPQPGIVWRSASPDRLLTHALPDFRSYAQRCHSIPT
jgi:hypothetical protein